MKARIGRTIITANKAKRTSSQNDCPRVFFSLLSLVALSSMSVNIAYNSIDNEGKFVFKYFLSTLAGLSLPVRNLKCNIKL